MDIKTIVTTTLSGIGVATIGAVATIASGAFGYWNTDRSHDIEMVRVSLSILAGENKDSSLPGRKFALRALSKYADVEIPDNEFEDWAKSGTIPEIKLSLSDYVTNPTQTPLQHGAIRLTAGGGLFALPIVYEAMKTTLDSGDGPANITVDKPDSTFKLNDETDKKQ